MNKDMIIGTILLVLGFLIFVNEYIIPGMNENNVYKLFGIPIIYIAVKKIKGEKIF